MDRAPSANTQNACPQIDSISYSGVPFSELSTFPVKEITVEAHRNNTILLGPDFTYDTCKIELPQINGTKQ